MSPPAPKSTENVTETTEKKENKIIEDLHNDTMSLASSTCIGFHELTSTYENARFLQPVSRYQHTVMTMKGQSKVLRGILILHQAKEIYDRTVREEKMRRRIEELEKENAALRERGEQ